MLQIYRLHKASSYFSSKEFCKRVVLFKFLITIQSSNVFHLQIQFYIEPDFKNTQIKLEHQDHRAKINYIISVESRYAEAHVLQKTLFLKKP